MFKKESRLFILLTGTAFILLAGYNIIFLLNSSKTALKDAFHVINQKYWIELATNQLKLKDCLLETVDEVRSKTTLKKAVGNSRKLILRFSETDCNVCLDDELKRLKEFAGKVGSEKIILIGSYTNTRDLFAFKQIRELNFPTYNISQEAFGLPIEKNNTPFLFLADSTLVCSSTYLSVKEFPQYSERYYKNIEGLLIGH